MNRRWSKPNYQYFECIFKSKNTNEILLITEISFALLLNLRYSYTKICLPWVGNAFKLVWMLILFGSYNFCSRDFLIFEYLFSEHFQKKGLRSKFSKILLEHTQLWRFACGPKCICSKKFGETWNKGYVASAPNCKSSRQVLKFVVLLKGFTSWSTCNIALLQVLQNFLEQMKFKGQEKWHYFMCSKMILERLHVGALAKSSIRESNWILLRFLFCLKGFYTC